MRNYLEIIKKWEIIEKYRNYQEMGNNWEISLKLEVFEK